MRRRRSAAQPCRPSVPAAPPYPGRPHTPGIVKFTELRSHSKYLAGLKNETSVAYIAVPQAAALVLVVLMLWLLYLLPYRQWPTRFLAIGIIALALTIFMEERRINALEHTIHSTKMLQHTQQQ
jgi:hypothetical protein